MTGPKQVQVEKVYRDGEGTAVAIYKLVKLEPEWAANRVLEGEKAEARVKELEEGQRKLFGIIIRLGAFVVRECCAIDDWDEKASNRLRGAVVQAKKEAEAAKKTN